MKKAESKASIMSKWTNENTHVLKQVTNQWKEFNVLLEAHKDSIHQQVRSFYFELGGPLEKYLNSLFLFQMDSFKSSTQIEIMNFTSKVEAFHQNWFQNRPNKDIFRDDKHVLEIDSCLSFLRSQREEWKDLMEIQSQLK